MNGLRSKMDTKASMILSWSNDIYSGLLDKAKFDMLDSLFKYAFEYDSSDNSFRITTGMTELLGDVDDGIDILLDRLKSIIKAEDFPIFERTLSRALADATQSESCLIRLNDMPNEQMLMSVRASGKDNYQITGVLYPLSESFVDVQAGSNVQKETLTLQNSALEFIIEGCENYFFYWDIIQKKVFISPHLVKQLPVSESESHSYGLDLLMSIIQREYREHIVTTLGAISRGERSTAQVEFCVNTRSGEVMRLSGKFGCICNAQGKRQLIVGALQDQSAKYEYEQRLEKMAYIDPDTKLYNLSRLKRDLGDSVHEQGSIVAIAMDHLKRCNAVFGRDFGDKLIAAFVKRYKRILPPRAGLYRTGGSEFIVFWPGSTLDQAHEFASELLAKTRKVWSIEGSEYYFTASIGVARYDRGGSAENAYNNAHAALNEAKDNGRDRAVFFSDKYVEQRLKILDVESQLQTSIKSNFRDFEVYFQPIVYAGKGTWMGAEALLRWRSTRNNNISTQLVIENLEQMGKINEVGEWVLERAVEQCVIWRKNGFENFSVNVNLSTIQLHNGDLVDFVLRTLKKHDLPPEALVLEVTETSLIKDMKLGISVLENLRSHGVKVALDDFGTGYSSLSYMRELPMDQIKIDRKFVSDIIQSDFNRLFVRSVVDLAHSIDLQLCIEGIETDEQQRILNAMNADKLQGYLFGKPMSVIQFTEKLYAQKQNN